MFKSVWILYGVTIAKVTMYKNKYVYIANIMINDWHVWHKMVIQDFP